MLDTINNIYRDLGFIHRISGKSAKYCGVSMAFKSGLTIDQIRLLGRWRSCDTPQYYRDIDPSLLSIISNTMNMSLNSQSSSDLSNSKGKQISLSLSTILRPNPLQIVDQQPCVQQQSMTPAPVIPHLNHVSMLPVQDQQHYQLHQQSVPIFNKLVVQQTRQSVIVHSQMHPQVLRPSFPNYLSQTSRVSTPLRLWQPAAQFRPPRRLPFIQPVLQPPLRLQQPPGPIRVELRHLAPLRLSTPIQLRPSVPIRLSQPMQLSPSQSFQQESLFFNKIKVKFCLIFLSDFYR